MRIALICILCVVCTVILLPFTGCGANENAAAVTRDNAGALAPSSPEGEPETLLEFTAPTPLPVAKHTAASPSDLSGGIVAATFTLSPTPNVTPEPTATPAPTPLPYELKTVEREKGYVKGHDVKLREGPGTEYDVIDIIRYHSKVVITAKTTGEQDIWYQIEVDDQEGFMSKEFVGLGGTPTPTPTPKATAKPTTKPTAKPTETPEEEKNQDVEIPEIQEEEEEISQGDKGDYSDDDIYLAAKLIYAEGKNQSTESFLAMANLLWNRCNSSRFGGSVEREVYRSGQFSVVEYDSFKDLAPSKAALSAAERVFNGGERVLPAGVLYFRSARSSKSWGSHEFYKTIGGNDYYYH